MTKPLPVSCTSSLPAWGILSISGLFFAAGCHSGGPSGGVPTASSYVVSTSRRDWTLPGRTEATTLLMSAACNGESQTALLLQASHQGTSPGMHTVVNVIWCHTSQGKASIQSARMGWY